MTDFTAKIKIHGDMLEKCVNALAASELYINERGQCVGQASPALREAVRELTIQEIKKTALHELVKSEVERYITGEAIANVVESVLSEEVTVIAKDEAAKLRSEMAKKVTKATRLLLSKMLSSPDEDLTAPLHKNIISDKQNNMITIVVSANPCPFCSATPIQANFVDGPDKNYGAIQCPLCGALGPRTPKAEGWETLAVRAWNARPFKKDTHN